MSQKDYIQELVDWAVRSGADVAFWTKDELGANVPTRIYLYNLLDEFAECTSEADLEEAREAGYEDGYNEGWDEGHAEGYAEGVADTVEDRE